MGRLKRMGIRCGLLLGTLLTISGCQETTLLAAIRQLVQASQSPQWARTLSAGTMNSKLFSVATDAFGNVYVAGFITGSGSYGFGNGVYAQGANTAGTGINALLVKYDSSGAAQWARSATAGADDSMFYSVAVDSSGNAYTVGFISGTGNYEWGTVTVNGTNSAGSGYNAVLVKYNSSGTAQWARSVTAGVNDSSFRHVKLDSSGNIYAVGSMVGTSSYTFGGSGTAQGGAALDNAVLVKYNTAGTALWARTCTSADRSKFYHVALDSSGSVYVAGFIFGIAAHDFGNSVTPGGPWTGVNAVLLKYSSAGTPQWSRVAVGGTGDTAFWSVALDPSGNIYTTGYVTGIGGYDFGNGAAVAGAAPAGNALLVKYDSIGDPQWARSVTSGSALSRFWSAAVDSSGNIYASGYATGTGGYGFGNGVTFTGPSTLLNAVLVKYDSTGVAQVAQGVLDGLSSSEYWSVKIDTAASVYVAGYVTGTGSYAFGSGVTAAGTSSEGNALLVKY